MPRPFLSIALFVALVLFFIMPASAVVQEVTVKGTVATVNDLKNTLTINDPVQYGCTYSSPVTPLCTWAPVKVSELTGTMPDAAAATIFKAGDPIVGTSTGGAGDTWITLAKLYGSRPNEEFITDIVGEPETIPQHLIGDYALDLEPTPDCTACSGDTCTAQSSHVTLLSGGKVVSEKILLPSESLTFNGRNDGSVVSVTFVRGEALSASCQKTPSGSIGGIQPVSDYIVKVVPPVSFNQNNIRTATTTRPDEALPTGTPITISTATSASPVTTIPSLPAPTTSGSLPLMAAGALSLAGIVFAVRKP